MDDQREERGELASCKFLKCGWGGGQDLFTDPARTDDWSDRSQQLFVALDEGDGMADDPDIWQQLRQPDSPAAGMAAAHEAFAEMLLAIRRYQDGGGPFFASFVMASAAAANGRDAIASAPSLASAPRGTRKLHALQDQDSAAGVAAWLAALSKAVADCLHLLAGQAVEAEDREACRNGALYADELHHLVAGNEP